MEKLSSVSGLRVSQQKEWGEILLNFETKNRYVISDESGKCLYFAVEKRSSTLSRYFLKAHRPFQIFVVRENSNIILRVVRSFRFYFHRAEIIDSQEQLLGVIERRFSLLHRVYSVFDSSGKEIYTIISPLLHPWTFHIRKDKTDYGEITKKWSGVLKEIFTDADNFGIVFPAEWDIRLKALFLGSVFLIDFIHFER